MDPPKSIRDLTFSCLSLHSTLLVCLIASQIFGFLLRRLRDMLVENKDSISFAPGRKLCFDAIQSSYRMLPVNITANILVFSPAN